VVVVVVVVVDVVVVDVLVVDVLVVDVLDVVDVDVVGGEVVEASGCTVVVVGGCVDVTTIVVGRASVVSRPSDCTVELHAVNAPANNRSSVLARRSDTQRTVAPISRNAMAPLRGLPSPDESLDVHPPRHDCRRQSIERGL
jgi:hypothetical protein